MPFTRISVLVLAFLITTGAFLGAYCYLRAQRDTAQDELAQAKFGTELQAVARTPATSAPHSPALGTLRMVQTLERLAAESDLKTNIFKNVERLQSLRAARPPKDPRTRIKFDFQFGQELLRVGEAQEAVGVFESVWSRVRADSAFKGTPFAQDAHTSLALAYLRLGEQENCVALHGVDSCLIPIQGTGIHQAERGSRSAIEIYKEILAENPNDLTSLWLLNVASMTVKEYPAGVPARWRIPPEAFRSEHDIKRFYNVATPLGLDAIGLAGGAILDDFDGDAYLDLVVSSWGLRDQLRYFRSEANGKFTERTESAGLKGLVSGLNILQADYDNDGDLDLFVLRGAWLGENGRLPNSLIRNNGDGTFDDVTEESGLLSFHPTQAGAWGDYDNDGWLDLFIANESSALGPPHPCELYHNNGNRTFSNVAAQVGVAAVGFFKGTVWGDIDNDGLLDLYLSGVSEKPSNLLFHNDGMDARGQWRLTEVGTRAGVREPAASFPCWFFDYDNDGWLDIFVSGYLANAALVAAEYLGKPNNAEKPRLYHNNHDGTFRDLSKEARVDKVLLTMGCNFGDLDNDGWLDFYAATGNPDFRNIIPNRMFRNAEGKFFQDVTTSGGFGHLQKGHGVSFGDIDNDGDQDVYCKIGGAFTGDSFRSALFLNPGHGNSWITLILKGVKCNRAAIGARIRVGITGPSGERDIHVTVGGGSSFGASSLRQEIGLGPSARIREIEIRWPGNSTAQRFENVGTNQILEIHEGEPKLIPVTLKKLDLASSAGG